MHEGIKDVALLDTISNFVTTRETVNLRMKHQLLNEFFIFFWFRTRPAQKHQSSILTRGEKCHPKNSLIFASLGRFYESHKKHLGPMQSSETQKNPSFVLVWG